MVLGELLAYKSHFYFLKNDIDVKFYKDATKEFLGDVNLKNFSAEMLENVFENNPKLMVVVKTKYGNFVICDYKNVGYLKYFVVHNSSEFCAGFVSQRVSDMYVFSYAEKGQLKRFFSTIDGEVVSQGSASVYEKKVKHQLAEEDGVSNVDEDDILTCINNCVGFDILKKDVEILDVGFYLWEGVVSNVPSDVALKIYDNCVAQNIKKVSICFCKSNKSKNILIIASATVNNSELFLYSYLCKSNFSYDDFLQGFNTALYCLADFNYINCASNENFNQESRLFSDMRLYRSLNFTFDNVIYCTFNVEEKGELYAFLARANKKDIKAKNVVHNGAVIENFNPLQDNELVYHFVKKNIARKSFRKFGFVKLRRNKKI